MTDFYTESSTEVLAKIAIFEHSEYRLFINCSMKNPKSADKEKIKRAVSNAFGKNWTVISDDELKYYLGEVINIYISSISKPPKILPFYSSIDFDSMGCIVHYRNGQLIRFQGTAAEGFLVSKIEKTEALTHYINMTECPICESDIFITKDGNICSNSKCSWTPESEFDITMRRT